MKTLTTSLLIFLGLLNCTIAQEITNQMAATVARNFLYEKVCQHVEPVAYSEIGIAESMPWQDGNKTLLYIFNMKPSGFVIVAGNRAMTPVLGYNSTGAYQDKNQPPNVSYWIGHYADQVKFVGETQLPPSDAVAANWEKYLADDFQYRDIGPLETIVGPLLTSEWNQNWPYNYYCPEDPLGPGGHTWAGCMATAQVQIAYYWRWPDHGRGYCSYIPEIHPEYGVQSADFENTWYAWERMVDEPATVNLAIAELTYHSAVNMHMDFTPTGSAGNSPYDSSAYRFRLAPYSWHYKDSMPLAQFTGLLRQMLDDGCPIWYRGGPYFEPHLSVCDGYQDTTWFHFNLGWGGASNGWYSLDDIFGYTFDQFMTSHLYPDTLNFNYPPYASGADTMIALEGSITDGSGPIHDYLNNTYCTWLIDPQTDEDSIQFIKLDVRRFSTSGPGDHLVVYDGGNTTSPVLADLSGDTLPPLLVSSGNRVLVEFTSDASRTGPGFLLDYLAIEPVYCQGMISVSDSGCHILDGSGRFNYHNSASCKWRLEPEGCDSSLTLHFNWFDTEPEHDVLEIYDFETQNLLATYSGYYAEPPPPVTASSGKMFLIFKTNNTITAQGWEAWYGDVTGIREENPIHHMAIIPNPVRETAKVEYTLNSTANVHLEIINLFGETIWQQATGRQYPGRHSLDLETGNLASGIYFVRLQVGNDCVTRKVVKL